ncbi:GATA transcription factor 26 [Morella rubra]|uniref:GATA transcription factor 26 n=1 Tax=Morella rubra TaxID=262757 RepID=A0A6A1V1M1_9ROSI|nr:GATA transcription factor 26 [Morella rubra]
MGLLRGPCNQCGVITTLPWRVGPPEKPELVLCIACGTKYYRTRGTLANLAPTKKFPGYPPKRPTCSEDNSETKYDSEDDSETKCASSSPSSSLQRVDGDQIPGNSRNRSGTTLSDLSHIENLQRVPFSTVEHDPGASDSAEDVVLIYNANSLFVSPNEIGLGAVLLKPTSSDVNTMDGTTDDQKTNQRHLLLRLCSKKSRSKSFKAPVKIQNRATTAALRNGTCQIASFQKPKSTSSILGSAPKPPDEALLYQAPGISTRPPIARFISASTLVYLCNNRIAQALQLFQLVFKLLNVRQLVPVQPLDRLLITFSIFCFPDVSNVPANLSSFTVFLTLDD